MFRVGPDLTHTTDPRDFFAPSDWKQLDDDDLDLSGVTPLPLTLAGNEMLLALVLLRHSFCLTVCSGGRPQQGHRGRTRTSVRARRIRRVAIEFGTWRCDRSGRSSGSVTGGNGRLRASPDTGRS